MTGTVTISIEIELAWGHHDIVGPKFPALSPGRTEETEALATLLDWCDELSIPITFDVVGHLLHRECSGTHPGPHDSGWFDADPGTDVETDPHFYAPDLIEMIRSAPTDHEITTHTYSHALCSVHSPEIIDWEFERAFEIHEDFGLSRPRTFVPPRHQQPQNETLERHLIRVVRTPFEGYSNPTNRVLKFYEALKRSHPIVDNQWVGDVLKTYCLPYPTLTTKTLPTGRRLPHPAFRALPATARQRLHERNLSAAVEQTAADEGTLHLWTHLYNLSNELQMQPIQHFLRNLAERRDMGAVTIKPMAALLDGESV